MFVSLFEKCIKEDAIGETGFIASSGRVKWVESTHVTYSYAYLKEHGIDTDSLAEQYDDWSPQGFVAKYCELTNDIPFHMFEGQLCVYFHTNQKKPTEGQLKVIGKQIRVALEFVWEVYDEAGISVKYGHDFKSFVAYVRGNNV